jgi:hypothetical protein
MNERIKKLILEAGFPVFGQMYVVSDGEELDKFAQLIIKDCLDWCNAHARWDGTAQKIAESIREHFGDNK